MSAKKIAAPLHESLFHNLAEVLDQRWGVHFKPTPKNQRMLEVKLAPLLGEFQMSNFTELYERIKSSGMDSDLSRRVAQVITINTTQFFREKEHFKHFNQFAYNIWLQKQRKVGGEVTIWVAASSTGQEAYTLAMLLLEINPMMRFRILSTDIDHKALEYGARGTYSELEMRYVPDEFKQKYFSKSELSPVYKINSKVANHVTFAPFNLVNRNYPFKTEFDFIFCRNVFIYFRDDVTKKIVNRMVDRMAKGSYLFVGHTESTLVHNRRLTYLVPSVFRRDK